MVERKRTRRSVLIGAVGIVGALTGCSSPKSGSLESGSTSGSTSGVSSKTRNATATDSTTTSTSSSRTSSATSSATNASASGNATKPSGTGNGSNGSANGSGTQGAKRAPYYLKQGSHCIPVYPFTGKKGVKHFYGYRTPSTNPPGNAYGSTGTKFLQQPNTSMLLLYRGKGMTSLVIVHGDLNGTSGGSVTFTFEGLPKGGKWVVKDDSYKGNNRFDRWNLTGNTSQVDWTWGKDKADGGVYTGLGSHPHLTIEPAFNRQAALYGKHYEGKVKQWQVVSSKNGQVVRHHLDMTKPITITDRC